MTAFALILAALAAALSLPNLGRATIPVGTALAMLNLTLLPDIALRLAALSGMPTFLSTGDPIVVGCLMYAGLILLLTGAFADLCSLRRRAGAEPWRRSPGLTAGLVVLTALVCGQTAGLAGDWIFGLSLAA